MKKYNLTHKEKFLPIFYVIKKYKYNNITKICLNFKSPNEII